MGELRFRKDKPYFSTLTRRYYSDYDAAFRDSIREGGGAYVDFNLSGGILCANRDRSRKPAVSGFRQRGFERLPAGDALVDIVAVDYLG